MFFFSNHHNNCCITRFLLILPHWKTFTLRDFKDKHKQKSNKITIGWVFNYLLDGTENLLLRLVFHTLDEFLIIAATTLGQISDHLQEGTWIWNQLWGNQLLWLFGLCVLVPVPEPVGCWCNELPVVQLHSWQSLCGTNPQPTGTWPVQECVGLNGEIMAVWNLRFSIKTTLNDPLTHQHRDAECTSRLSKDGDWVWVSVKGLDVVTNPLQTGYLVQQAPVSRAVLISSTNKRVNSAHWSSRNPRSLLASAGNRQELHLLACIVAQVWNSAHCFSSNELWKYAVEWMTYDVENFTTEMTYS